MFSTNDKNSQISLIYVINNSSIISMLHYVFSYSRPLLVRELWILYNTIATCSDSHWSGKDGRITCLNSDFNQRSIKVCEAFVVNDEIDFNSPAHCSKVPWQLCVLAVINKLPICVLTRQLYPHVHVTEPDRIQVGTGDKSQHQHLWL